MNMQVFKEFKYQADKYVNYDVYNVFFLVI